MSPPRLVRSSCCRLMASVQRPVRLCPCYITQLNLSLICNSVKGMAKRDLFSERGTNLSPSAFSVYRSLVTGEGGGESYPAITRCFTVHALFYLKEISVKYGENILLN